MTSTQVLVDAYGRIRDGVHDAVEGLVPAQLEARLDAEANTIAWLVWHLTRVQDDHVAEVAGVEQRWTARGWMERYGLPFDAGSTGYGHTSEDVAAVRVATVDLLPGYHDEVYEQTVDFLGGIDDTALDRVVDEAWDPPVTLAVRLVSVVADDLQHVGQAAYVRGILLRR